MEAVGSSSLEGYAGYAPAATQEYTVGSQASGQADFSRQLTKQLTRTINENLRPEGDFDESPRGENHSPFIYLFTAGLLRIGASLQAGCLVFMCLLYLGFGGGGLFVFDEFAGPESVRISDAFHLLTAILMVGYLVGTVLITLFQLFVADSSKWPLGFRAGSKTLSCAATLDAVAGCLRVVQCVHSYFFSTVQWWAKYQRTQSDWGLYHLSSTLHSFALVMYGVGFFLLESYHDQGTYEEYAWAMLGLYTTAGLAELVMVYTGFGAFFTLFLVAALIVTVNWAFQFEPLLEKWSPDLHSRNLNENMLPFAETPSEKMTVGGDQQSVSSMPAFGTARYTTREIPMEGGSSPQHSTSLGVPLSTYSMSMPGVNQMPTTYDYSALHEQLASGGAEPGLVR
ncbi:glideosome-associated protein with multiple-membrane spans GAPM2B [Besnoitia besnoiti]|uniref:Glideosome-associated protein with multiple-membrane spans GAPM2B n=1 Tax=Besnoitia besnoiti TaxID=94643 RepID=A0A2A9MDE6_BESBE|nr:glideosome-associated protein with multiple-membrane spans GAPM2B [Besnoitia besnoiti]PFH36015.1 glideosome-associated protein with multiple-membrane spans GAPM2B [Besnoitia besnoiti]